jgi:general secretion pathway protein J
MRRPGGFTLLELLVAIAVFAVLSAVAYGGLRAVLASDQQTRTRSELLAELQVALAVLERDLLQAVAVSPRDRYGDAQPPLRYSPVATEPELLLVRAGHGGEERLRRVGWRVTEAGLERRAWRVIDAGDDSAPMARVFLAAPAGGATGGTPLAMELRFHAPAGSGSGFGDGLDGWPPLRGAPEETPRLPALVEVALEIPGLGRVERHLALPAGW